MRLGILDPGRNGIRTRKNVWRAEGILRIIPSLGGPFLLFIARDGLVIIGQ